VLVIGGGIAGLVTAAFAARAGASVVLLDGRGFGGRGRSDDVGSFRFNQGAHALCERCELMRALDELGVAVPGGPPSLDIGVIVDGARCRYPTGARSLATTKAVGTTGRVRTGLLLQSLQMHRGGDPVGRSVDEWLHDRKLPPDAAALVNVLIRVSTYTNAPDLLDAGAAAVQLRRAIRGVRYLDGGWQTIVDGLQRAATAAGARLVDHARVDALARSGDGWVAVTPTDEHPAATVVIAAGGPVVATRLLGLDAGELGETGPPARAACLDVGLAGPARETVLFSADEPLYWSTHMPPARLGPPGTVVAHAMRYLAPDESLSPDAGRAALWAHARAAGVDVGLDAGAPAVLAHRYLHGMIASHGLPLARSGGLAGRPAVAVPGSPGAFLAGDWVGPTGMLADAAAASGRRAAELAVAHARATAGSPASALSPTSSITRSS
jgi:phytoene dehydrogenase-like protein